MKKVISVVATIAFLTAGASISFAGGGEKVFKKKCKGCHTTTAKKKMGPGLKGVFGKESTIAGTLDDAGLTAWLKDPKAVNKKTKMPNPKLKDDQIASVIEYLKTL
ncbi:MAG: c-type cytochrome [Thermodesulfovibrionia bacterium]|nr:c-type cytochrome [Thermodesulfovibrionia bacterium]